MANNEKKADLSDLFLTARVAAENLAKWERRKDSDGKPARSAAKDLELAQKSYAQSLDDIIEAGASKEDIRSKNPNAYENFLLQETRKIVDNLNSRLNHYASNNTTLWEPENPEESTPAIQRRIRAREAEIKENTQDKKLATTRTKTPNFSDLFLKARIAAEEVAKKERVKTSEGKPHPMMAQQLENDRQAYARALDAIIMAGARKEDIRGESEESYEQFLLKASRNTVRIENERLDHYASGEKSEPHIEIPTFENSKPVIQRERQKREAEIEKNAGTRNLASQSTIINQDTLLAEIPARTIEPMKLEKQPIRETLLSPNPASDIAKRNSKSTELKMPEVPEMKIKLELRDSLIAKAATTNKIEATKVENLPKRETEIERNIEIKYLASQSTITNQDTLHAKIPASTTDAIKLEKQLPHETLLSPNPASDITKKKSNSAELKMPEAPEMKIKLKPTEFFSSKATTTIKIEPMKLENPPFHETELSPNSALNIIKKKSSNAELRIFDAIQIKATEEAFISALKAIKTDGGNTKEEHANYKKSLYALMDSYGISYDKKAITKESQSELRRIIETTLKESKSSLNIDDAIAAYRGEFQKTDQISIKKSSAKKTNISTSTSDKTESSFTVTQEMMAALKLLDVGTATATSIENYNISGETKADRKIGEMELKILLGFESNYRSATQQKIEATRNTIRNAFKLKEGENISKEQLEATAQAAHITLDNVERTAQAINKSPEKSSKTTAPTPSPDIIHQETSQTCPPIIQQSASCIPQTVSYQCAPCITTPHCVPSQRHVGPVRRLLGAIHNHRQGH